MYLTDIYPPPPALKIIYHLIRLNKAAWKLRTSNKLLTKLLSPNLISSTLGKKRPKPSQSPRNSLESHRIDVVTRRNLLELIILLRINNFSYPMPRTTKNTRHLVESPPWSEFRHHISIYRDVTHSKRRQFLDGETIVLSSDEDEVDVGAFAQLVDECAGFL